MIELIVGPMFSTKTTTLLSRLERAVFAKKKVLLIRPNTDTRNFISHNPQVNINKRIDVVTTDDLLKIKTDAYDVIGIDEGQFHKNLTPFCIRESRNKKQIYIAALNASSEQKMFAEIINVFPYCEQITKLNAVCVKTGSDFANFTHYIGNTKKTSATLVGSAEYESLCFDAAEEFFEEEKI